MCQAVRMATRDKGTIQPPYICEDADEVSLMPCWVHKPLTSLIDDVIVALLCLAKSQVLCGFVQLEKELGATTSILDATVVFFFTPGWLALWTWGGGVLSDCLSFFISVVCQKNQRKLHQLFLTECCNQVANADSPFCRLPPPTPGSAPTLNFTQISSLSSELYNPLMKTDWCKKHQGIWRPFPSSPWCPRALRRKQQHTCNQRGVEFILLCWTHCAIPAEPIRRNARKAGVSSLTKSGLLWMTTTLEH